MKNQLSYFLNSNDEQIIKDLFNDYSTSDKNIKHIEFIEMVFIKNLIDSRYSVNDFSNIYKKIQTENNKVDDRRFYLLINECCDLLYPGSKKPIHKLLTRFNCGVSSQNELEIRKYQWCDNLKRILDYEFIEIIFKYEYDLQKIFTLYAYKNFNKSQIFLTWKELKIQNYKIPLTNIMRYLRDTEVIPAIINLEFLNEILNKVIIPNKEIENKFFYEKKLKEYYDISNTTKDSKKDGDPGASFGEFIIILLKIFVELFKDKESNEVLLTTLLDNFLKDNLFLRKNEENKFKPNMPEMISEKFNIYHENIETGNLNKIKNQIKKDSLLPYHMILSQDNGIDNFIDLIRKSEACLSKFDLNNDENNTNIKKSIIIGDPIPIGKDKQKEQKKPVAKNKEPIIPYEENKPTYYTPNYKRIIDYHKRLFSEEGPITMEKASFSEIDVGMEILKEVLFPLNLNDQNVYVNLESVFENQINGNYEISLRDLNEAKKCLEKDNKDLTIELEIFFEFIEGTIYESANRDDLAIQSYLNCKKKSDKLDSRHPDRSLYLIGLGTIFYHSQEYELSARAFYDAKNIRENTIGPDTVETANIYNNLACAIAKLRKFKEANNYLRVAEAIMDYELGTFHERTLIVKRNKQKCMKGNFNVKLPNDKNTWIMYYEDKYKNIGKGGKKATKKKK